MTIDISTLSNDEKAAVACLYFARLPSYDERYTGKWSQTLSLLSTSYNIKYATLKNNKDCFDAQFDNGRRGWHQTPLEKKHKFLYEKYLQYKDISLEELQEAVERISDEARQEGSLFYTIRTSMEDSVKAILEKQSGIEISGLNVFKEKLVAGQPVFIALGGDKPKWETGLIGIGVISQPPYDEGYSKKNFKIKININVLLDKPVKREQLVDYKDTYDIAFVGPMTKWEPNQAVASVPEKKAVALMRAMLELCPAIESDLSNIIDERLMSRVKGTIIKLVPQEVDYGETVQPYAQTEDDDEASAGSDNFADSYEPDIDMILAGFAMPAAPILCLKNFINTQKHIIMTGPPGTGKTTLAERACEEAVRLNYISGWIMTTAVSDWTTFDTIGGYMPDRNGFLTFQEGIFLKSIRENKWLVIDEINRAEVDKAFGHFFTVLSGKAVELQYKIETAGGSKNISIHCTDGRRSFYDPEAAVYYIGRSWRIIATMNTYDKNSLFMLSYAFMRRFAFVSIQAPSEAAFTELIDSRLADHTDTARILAEIIKASPKKMGAAVILDLIQYLETAGYEGIAEGVCSLLIPQYEGISPASDKTAIPQLRHAVQSR